MAAISRVYTVARVAELLGVDEELLWDLATAMDEYDGCLWIYDVRDNQTMAFTDYGIEISSSSSLTGRPSRNPKVGDLRRLSDGY